MAEKTTAILTGRTYWFKGLGAPRLNEYAGEKQWTFDLEVTPEIRAWLKENNLLDKIKKTQEGVLKKTPDGSDYISFKRKEFNRDGEALQPWRIVDADGAPWNETTLIGNGSKIRVKVNAIPLKVGGRSMTGLYAQAIQVGELVPFVSNEFGAWDAETTTEVPPAKKTKPKADALAEVLDDNPFDE